MNEYEVLLLEKIFGRVLVKANSLEEAKKVALTGNDEVEWDGESTTEVAFVHRVD